MGATNEIKGTNISLQLEGKKCPQCQQVFTQAEIDDQNYDIWFDTSNDVKLIEMEKIEEKMDRLELARFNDQYWDMLYCPFGREGYQFSIWIRSIEHENCPDTETCQSCYSRFRIEEVKEFQDYYYCSPCLKEITDKEKSHE